MVTTFNILVVLALFIAAIGVVAMASVSAATITYPYEATKMNNGVQVFYIVIDSDGGIHPASSGEVAGLDAAMADGTLKQEDRDQYLGRGVQ